MGSQYGLNAGQLPVPHSSGEMAYSQEFKHTLPDYFDPLSQEKQRETKQEIQQFALCSDKSGKSLLWKKKINLMQTRKQSQLTMRKLVESRFKNSLRGKSSIPSAESILTEKRKNSQKDNTIHFVDRIEFCVFRAIRAESRKRHSQIISSAISKTSISLTLKSCESVKTWFPIRCHWWT
jgi:hypothetical protein